MTKFFLGCFLALSFTTAFAQDIQVEGIYEKVAIDHINKPSEIEEFVIDHKTRKAFRLKKMKREFTHSLRSGEKIRFKARQVRTATTNSTSSTSSTSAPAELEVTGDPVVAATTVAAMPAVGVKIQRSVLTVFVSSNDGSAHMSPSTMTTVLNNAKSLYTEQTHGKLELVLDKDGVSGFDYKSIKILTSTSNCDNYPTWRTMAETVLTNLGVPWKDYNHLVLVLPSNQSGCTWAGLGTIGALEYPYNLTTWVRQESPPSPRVTAHEIGHNLGLHHAATDPNNDQTPDVEYGDASCFMGTKIAGSNAPHKIQLAGYADFPKAIVDSRVNDAVYYISASDLNPATAPYPQVIKLLKTPSGTATGDNYYYLSYKRGVGMYESSGLLPSVYKQGVSIHSHKGGSNLSLYIDTLAVGESFYDTINGVTVNMQAKGTDYVKVRVMQTRDFSCTRQIAINSSGSDSLSVYPNKSSVLSFSIVNKNSFYCPPSANYTVTVNPAGGTLSASKTSFALNSNQSTSMSVTLVAGTAIGAFSPSFTITDETGVSVSKTLNLNVIPNNVPAPTNVAVVQEGYGARVSWIAPAGISVKNYFVYSKSANATSFIKAIQSTTTNGLVSGSNAGSTFYVTTVDVNGGESQPSAQVVFNPPPPAAIAGLALAAGTSSISLSWPIPTPPAGVYRYMVYAKVGTAASFSLAGYASTNSFTYNYLKTASFYVVVQDKNMLESAPSNIVSYTAPAPAAPVIALNGTSISWGAVASAASYKVYRQLLGAASFSPLISTTGLTYSISTSAASYYVTALDAAQSESAPSNIVSYAPPAVAAPVISLSGSNLTWSPVPGLSYTVYKTPAGATAPTAISVGSVGSYSAGVATVETSYYVIAKDISTTVVSPSSNIVVVSALEKSLAPSGLAAVQSGSMVKLTWSLAAAGASYQVYQKASGAASYTKIGLAVSTNTNSVSMPAAETSYVVKATEAGKGESDASNEVVFTPPPQAAAPENFAVAISGTYMKFTWSAVAGATSYRIQRKTSTSFANIYSTSTNSYQTSMATTSYTYRVVAVVSGVDSLPSNEATFTPPAKSAAPTNLAVAVSGSNLVLSWSSVPSVTYKVWSKSASAASFSYLRSSTTTSSTIVLPFETTSYYVTAIQDGLLESLPSNQVTQVIELGPSPTNLTGSGMTSVNLSWRGAAGVTGYKIYHKPSSATGFAALGSVTTTTFYLSYPASGTQYYVVGIKSDGSETAPTNTYTYISNYIQ